MAYSTPSPSDTSSNWSSGGFSSFSDCGVSSTSTSTVSTTIDGDYTDLSPMLTRQTQRHDESVSVTPVPRSGTNVSTSTPGTHVTTRAMHSMNENPKPNQTRRRRYAAEEDWRRHRERISSLYKTKRLKDVMTIMETEHGLYATERMYKARFKDWGLQKNVTAAEVHKLMQKVTQEHQRRHQISPTDEHGRVVLDVGDDLDVRRIQKYMKRRPKGLDKLRQDPHRPLEVIKALSVDAGKGRGKVSIATTKLEEQLRSQSIDLTMSSLDLSLPWSPGPEVPDDITRLLQIFIDNGFDGAYTYACSPPAAFRASLSPQWQHHGHGHSRSLDSITSSFETVSSRDKVMLDFVLKFRAAHVLLDEGFMQQGYQGIDMCLDSLGLCLQQCQDTSSLSTRPATVVVIWALSAALEMMVDFKHMKKLVLHMLYQRLVTFCAAYQPTMAEIVRQLTQLGGREQEAAIKLARQMISRALFADPACYEPAFETYSRTVDVAVSLLSATDKLEAMQTLASKPILPGSSALSAWTEMRIALAVCQVAPSFSLRQDGYQVPDPLGLCSPVIPPSWNVQENKVASVFEYISGRIECNKAAGCWQTAQELASQAASVSEVAWGYDGEMPRLFRAEAEGLRSPGQVPCSMAALAPSLVPIDLPLACMSFSNEGVESLGSKQELGQGGQFLLPRPSLPLWGAQVDGSFGSPCGLMYDAPY